MDYRELQLSSSHLIFIFLGILALGVIIFLLGVSVGKKQAQIAQASSVSLEALPENSEKKVGEEAAPQEKTKDTIAEELASHREIKEKAEKQTTEAEIEKPYYVQVGAFTTRDIALSFAKEFESKGYGTLILDPLPIDKKPVFRVRVGGYSTREEAQKIKEELMRLGIKKRSDYFIIKK